ncbi:MAG: hypothetical protein ACR2GU_01640, partial [Rubrobacteraceae bacterium]
MRDAAEVQAAEIERLVSERNDLRSRHAALDAEHAESKNRNRAFEAERAALRNSTSWRLTLPIRAVKRLATDPRGTISFLRAKYME